ncbi:contact-dependent growth inhibition system immunity protein [Promicromonospora umidemergens]|uniref:CdiI immunity protein domain-containing protein n=1 Tax=Promicromonospora umidemergens TaxID=629679 RepID=A0ABP8XV02_9MICO
MEELRYLGSTYFHADYDLEASAPIEVVRKFRASEGEGTISGLRREIVGLLAQMSDDAVLDAAWLTAAGAAYDPRRDGVTTRDWLESILSVLDGR